MNKLIQWLEEYFGRKAPQLPVGFKEFLVKAAPYLAIIGFIIFAFALVPLLGFLFTAWGVLGSMGAYYGAYYGGAGMMWVQLILLVAVEVLYLMAIPGLFKRTSRAWDLVFYATLVSALGSLLAMNFISLIIGLLISFYFLFQVRPYYTGAASLPHGPGPKPMA